MGKNRTLSICISDVPKDRFQKHSNGKLYLNVKTYDLPEVDKFGNHFSVSLQMTKDELKQKEAGTKVPIIFVGSGKIWEDRDNFVPASEKDVEDALPY